MFWCSISLVIILGLIGYFLFYHIMVNGNLTPCLNVGFSSARTLTLSNSSDVPLTYCAFVRDDGSRPPVRFDHLVDADEDPDCCQPNAEIVELDEEPGTANTKPQEFTVRPSSGVVEPKCDVTFTVTLCANSVEQYFRQLAVKFDEVANETYTVPITAQYANRSSIFLLCSHGPPFTKNIKLGINLGCWNLR